jgi:hypothetical protein
MQGNSDELASIYFPVKFQILKKKITVTSRGSQWLDVMMRNNKMEVWLIRIVFF